MELREEIARELLQIHAIKLRPESPFTWASGLKSPIYCDNRLVLSYPGIRQLIIDAFLQKSTGFSPFNLIAGVATAGIPHGILLADRLNLPFVYVRAEAKSHGRQNRIEGDVKGHEDVVVIEDLISTGGSSLKAVEALRDAGCRIKGVLAIFTYGLDSAARAFHEVGCPFDTLLDYDSLIEIAIAGGYISADNLATLKEWRQSPQQWSNRH